jgi:DNA-binding transcriptional MerR regulator
MAYTALKSGDPAIFRCSRRLIMASQLSHKRVVDSTPAIPDRLYFKIGDVARICDLETYVLRFWETQFPQLKPNKSGTGQRLYRRRDVELVLEIKRLVHVQGYTLPGARQALDQAHRRPMVQRGAQLNSQSAPKKGSQSRLPLAATGPSQRIDSIAAAIGHARAELREIAGLLAAPLSHSPRRRGRMASLPQPAELLFPS